MKTEDQEMYLRSLEAHKKLEQEARGWLEYPKHKPTESGRFEVYRAGAKKQHYERWNTTGWAYNNNDITHFRRIITPLGEDGTNYPDPKQ